jgi:hypothetical protein
MRTRVLCRLNTLANGRTNAAFAELHSVVSHRYDFTSSHTRHPTNINSNVKCASIDFRARTP